MSESYDSNRRDFLTGRVVRNEMRRRGEALADALQDNAAERAAPVAGDTIRLETRAMACPWSVVMNPGPPRDVMVASDALEAVHTCEQMLTVFRSDSDVARLNRTAADGRQPVSDDLFSFLIRCRQLWEQTAGAFDPASGALIQLWRGARQAGEIPDPERVQEELQRCGFDHVRLCPEERSVSFDRPGLQLDFGAIGKGYGIDRAAAVLEREGVSDFLVHGGFSSLLARGRHGPHEGWPVGVRNPLFTESRYVTVLLKDEGLSTSGSNIQFFRHGGERYGHILDPRTGWPAAGLLSVTVIARTAEEADALSTAFYVMGLDKALAYCDDHPEIGAILIAPPVRGRVLEPIVRNIPAERLFFEPARDLPDDLGRLREAPQDL